MKKKLRQIGFILTVSAVSFSMTNCGGGMTEEEAAKMAAEMEASMNGAFDESAEESTSATTSEDVNATQEYDLSEHGIPVTIIGPVGASVKSDLTESGRVDFDAESYSVSKGKFAITVYMDNDPAGNTVETAIAESKVDLDGTIVEEFDSGFIYVDEDGSHDFVCVLEREGKILEFTAGLIFDDLSKEDIYAIVNSIKV